jgi:xylan 1,4-beta-xylosidase
MKIINPILRGFNPDPSILRVGEDYYIAVSTFEWFPGVLIHHSRDLVHWRLVARPLDRVELLDMKGNPPSGGVWAPCLSFYDGLFYLVYSDAKAIGRFKDIHNYLTTAQSIDGPWSAPVYLNSTGFDPSFFHDTDGRTWLLNMKWDFRPGRDRFAGIFLCEYDRATGALTGPERLIFPGTTLGLTEGPHLYRKNGLYYLMVAEGGTSLGHAVTVARSASIAGPYQVDPQNPILTSADAPTAELQKAGHGSLVETPQGESYLVHLCSRPIARRGRSFLGRETAIQKMVWTEDGWLRMADGGHTPQVLVEVPELPPHPWPTLASRDHFDFPVLGMEYQSPRVPLTAADYSLTERPGFLRLRGGESPASRHHQVLLARRLQDFSASVTICLEFKPESYQQMAGLILLYDVDTFFYLRMSHDDTLGICVGLLTWDRGSPEQPGADVSVDEWPHCHLRAVINYDQLQFSFGPDGMKWTLIGPVLDMSKLSDEYCAKADGGAFTGAFAGICCQDLTGRRLNADFDYFDYSELGGTVHPEFRQTGADTATGSGAGFQ